MTLDEAIHNLQLHLDGNPNLHDVKLRQAMHIGIEVLTLYLEIPLHKMPKLLRKLIDETEE